MFTKHINTCLERRYNMPLCECGCNQIAKKRFVNGHNCRGVKKLESTRKKMTEAMYKRHANNPNWNEGKTKYTDARLMQSSLKNIGQKRSPETLLKKSEAQKRVWKTRGYAEHFSTLRTGEKHPLWKGGFKIGVARRRAKRKRNLEWDLLNYKVDGWVGHHIDRRYVVYIPKELHEKYRHRLDKPETMIEINRIAFEILSQTVKQT